MHWQQCNRLSSFFFLLKDWALHQWKAAAHPSHAKLRPVSLGMYKEMRYQHPASMSYWVLIPFFPLFFPKILHIASNQQGESKVQIFVLPKPDKVLPRLVELSKQPGTCHQPLRDVNHWTFCFMLGSLCKTRFCKLYGFHLGCHQGVLGFCLRPQS